MRSQYSNQPVSDPEYMTLLGTTLYVFNANNAFIIENMLNISDYRDWWYLIDQESGTINSMIQGKHYSSAFNGHDEILYLFHEDVIELSIAFQSLHTRNQMIQMDKYYVLKKK